MYSRCCLLYHLDGCFRKKPCCSFLSFSGAYLHALLFVMVEKFKGLCSSRGCLGCCTTPPLVIAVDNPSKGLSAQAQTAKHPKDFWSSSTYDMDNSTVQSSVSNQALDPNSSNSSSNPPEFVNHGLLLWNETRQQWLQKKTSHGETQSREPRISFNASYESLLGTNKCFTRPIPLPEMIDFLVDIWDQEGLYD